MHRLGARVSGSRAFCPVCNQSVRTFVPFRKLAVGFIDDLNESGFDISLLDKFETLNVNAYACPLCCASDRDRLCALFLQDVLSREDISARLRLLDIAPSSLAGYILRSGRFDYRSADLFRDDVDDRVDIQNMSIYPDGTFDCLICSHVLEHVPDDISAMRELHRVLKPNGWGIVLVPILLGLETTREDPLITSARERMRLFAQDDHVRLYAKRDFVSRLQGVGFYVSEITERDLGERTFQRCGIASRAILYRVGK